MEKKFCVMCGGKLAIRETNNFDAYTGKKIKETYCTNLRCIKGCGAHGHIPEEFDVINVFTGFLGSSCTRCGSWPA